jgi:putative selenium metabolism hydrolase
VIIPGVDAEALANFSLRLIAEESLSGHEERVAEMVAAEMRKLGMEVEVDELGNVVGVIDAGPGPCVLVDSHMDTVGVTDPSAWPHSPRGERVGDRIYGRGSMDMKGPLAASVYGAALLKERLQSGKVVVSASVAEELVEGPATVQVARRVNPDYTIICEATALKVATGQRGRAEVTVEIQGRPTHSSRPELGVNAAEAMADLIVALREVRPPRHEVLGEGILVLTDIISRPYPGLSVVPDGCIATFDRRTLPGETDDDVLRPVRQVIEKELPRTGAKGSAKIAEDEFRTYKGAKIRAPNFAPAWYLSPDSALVAAAVQALQDAGLPAEITHYAFCTNGSGTCGVLGIPTLGFGPGDEQMAHRVDEYIELSELASAARGYAAIVTRLLETHP